MVFSRMCPAPSAREPDRDCPTLFLSTLASKQLLMSPLKVEISYA